jgi:hypothetical protein
MEETTKLLEKINIRDKKEEYEHLCMLIIKIQMQKGLLQDLLKDLKDTMLTYSTSIDFNRSIHEASNDETALFISCINNQLLKCDILIEQNPTLLLDVSLDTLQKIKYLLDNNNQSEMCFFKND